MENPGALLATLARLSGSNLQQIQFRAARLHCGTLARSLCEFVCECQSEWRRRSREREGEEEEEKESEKKV